MTRVITQRDRARQKTHHCGCLFIGHMTADGSSPRQKRRAPRKKYVFTAKTQPPSESHSHSRHFEYGLMDNMTRVHSVREACAQMTVHDYVYQVIYDLLTKSVHWSHIMKKEHQEAGPHRCLPQRRVVLGGTHSIQR